MRWNKKPWTGIRYRRGFLLLPKTVKKETRWLEWARWVDEYRGDWGGGGWVSVRWKEEDK